MQHEKLYNLYKTALFFFVFKTDKILRTVFGSATTVRTEFEIFSKTITLDSVV